MPQLWLRGDPIGDIKGVLFDKDGTLSNSERHLFKLAQLRIQQAIGLFKNQNASTNEISKLKCLLLSAYGLTKEGICPNGTLAIASRDNNLISTATVFCLLDKEWPNALEMASEIFGKVDALEGGAKVVAKQRVLLPGVLNLLQTLQKADIACALISNDTQEGILSFLRANNLEGNFSGVWSADNSPAKPNPKAVNELCKTLNLDPTECALIGDADSDLSMARKAGIGIILGYTAGWSTPPHLTQHQHLINHWNELNIHQELRVPINLESI